MRTIIPAIAIVVLLCLCAQWQINQWRYFRGAEEQLREVRAAQDARAKASTSQPTTQPAPLSEVTAEPE